MQEPNNLPERIVKDLKNSTQSFVIVYFNEDGFPMINIHAPSIKDFLALERMMIDYGGGLPLPEDVQGRDGFSGEEGEDGGADNWKKGY